MTIFGKNGSAAAVFAVLATAIAASSTAYASGAKEFFVEDYHFSKPMHGYSGHSGNYYCDYQRLPDRKCTIKADGTESCKIVGWTLREMCQ